jgi:hypothetical protein
VVAVDTNLLSALDYATRRWRVFPLHTIRRGRCTCGDRDCGRDAGKHPRTQHGLLDATTAEATIRRWWTRWPDANVAIATGAASGVWVLDVDPRHGGDDTLADLERQHGTLPPTITALTGGGGRHLLWKYTTPIPTKANVLPGIDVRGDGGYIVAPGSTHLSGKSYIWEIGLGPDEICRAEAPAWLVAPVTAREAGRLRRGRLCLDGPPLVIAAGARNDTLMRFGALLRRYGIGEAALAACLQTINRHHAQPPLSEAEVRRIAASVARYTPGLSTPFQPFRPGGACTDELVARALGMGVGDEVSADH